MSQFLLLHKVHVSDRWDTLDFDEEILSISVVQISFSAKTDKHEDNLFIYVLSDGTCFWYPFAIEISYCPMDIRWYPFDDQTCRLQYSSWSYDVTQLNLTLIADKIDTNLYRNSTAWRLMGQTLIFFKRY